MNVGTSGRNMQLKERIIGVSEEFGHDLALVAASLAIVVMVAAAHNYATPDEPLQVGFTEIETECYGIDSGVCLGIQRQTHTTYNYDNWTEPEPGTENYYRLVESELMVRAYNTCNSSMTGYDWTTHVSYDGKKAEEWRENENVELLPCEDTFYQPLEPDR